MMMSSCEVIMDVKHVMKQYFLFVKWPLICNGLQSLNVQQYPEPAEGGTPCMGLC